MVDPKLRRAIRLALATSAAASAFCGSAAIAQDQDQPTDDTLGTVVVTGSRISSPNLESISPVTAITAEDLDMTGKVRIEDIINQLPQAFAAQGSSISNGSDGTASVNLRGLGVNRTLVLVNGRRVMPGDPDGGSAADLNQIPLALVKRVDVLTGGASSVYGADAVAGVVNFIMDNDFEGVRLDANYTFYDHENSNQNLQDLVASRNFTAAPDSTTNGYARDFTFAMGFGGSDDSGHATFYATYRKVDAVLEADYDYSACALSSGNAFGCGGSGTTNPARFIAIDTTGFTGAAPGTDVTDDAVGAGGSLSPFTSADVYNFGPLNFYQRPDERYTFGAFANYDVSEKAQAYGEVMFMDDRSVAQIAPSGNFLQPQAVNCDSPFLSQTQRTAWCADLGLAPTDSTTLIIGRRNVEGGGRQLDIGHESIRAVAGFRGELSSAWSYDAYFQHGTTKSAVTSYNDFSIVRLGRSLAVRTDNRLDSSGNPVPTFGTPQCVSFIDGSDPACVPWNIFDLGQVTPESLNYLQTPAFIRANATQQIVHADFTGDLTSFVKLPTAESGLAINVGAEYRDEDTQFSPDIAFMSGDLAGSGGATTATEGGYSVKEAFMEARIPLVEGKTGIQALSFETGYRYSDYSSGFKTDTYKAGLDWAPIDQLRFRTSFQHAVRAPNVGELFATQVAGLDGTNDPCDGAPEATLAQCMLTGMTQAQYQAGVLENPAAQYNGLIGGNPDLQPEESDTVSFGLVWRPEFANLTLAVDYFDIEIEKTISGVAGGNADVYINQCIATGAAQFCDLIHRDSLGTLWISPTGFVEDTSLNLGGLTTEGIDIQASYKLNFGAHRLGFSLVGTQLLDASTAPLPDGDFYDCTGLYGSICGVPSPEWRHSLRADWSTPWAGLDISLAWRYFDGVDLDRSSTDSQLIRDIDPDGVNGPLLPDGIPDPQRTDAKFSARSYVDMTAAITFAENYTFRVGANNLLDQDPPLVGQSNCPAGPCNGNTFAQVYDTLGRQWFASVTVDF